MLVSFYYKLRSSKSLFRQATGFACLSPITLTFTRHYERLIRLDRAACRTPIRPHRLVHSATCKLRSHASDHSSKILRSFCRRARCMFPHHAFYFRAILLKTHGHPPIYMSRSPIFYYSPNFLRKRYHRSTRSSLHRVFVPAYNDLHNDSHLAKSPFRALLTDPRPTVPHTDFRSR